MPTNLIVLYNSLLQFLHRTDRENLESFRRVFDRDFVTGSQIIFKTLPVVPRPTGEPDLIEQLFWHLTTVEVDEKTQKREFETERSVRIHWIKHHLVTTVSDTLYFAIPDEKRIYILNKAEKYVVILDPSRRKDAYYLLTAYRLGDDNYRKIMRKFERRGEPI